MPHACGFTATPFTLLPEVREFIRDAKHHDAKPSFSTTRPRLPRNLNPALLTPPRTICLSIYLCIFGSLLSAARGTPSSFLPVPPCSARRSPSQHVGRSPPASVGAPAPPRRPSTWSPATTSSPLTRRAASTAQSIRLLLRSDLVCVLWSVRGLGSGCSSRCWFTSPFFHPSPTRRADGLAHGEAWDFPLA